MKQLKKLNLDFQQKDVQIGLEDCLELDNIQNILTMV